ncbi:fimbrial protein [Providencia manganoxydans]|uniref:fimbrial protein n=1 Tax=Providencia manganoxydans TaxID=2923283 RepID=UPI00280FB630|nr:type 1 fimbrial protein [Providencia stuartii]ELR5081775.1 type 1 fimbrial protein [Providencia stuartii]
MKKSLLVLLVASSVSASVMAADGTITFNGEITATTCDVTTGTGGDFTVTLPTVSTTALSAAGATAGNTSFTIELANCSVSGVDVAANFESLTSGDATTGNLIPSVSPANVQIGLADQAGNVAKVNGAPVGQQTITAGAATLAYQAFYYAKDVVTAPGVVTAQVNYTLTYP